MAWLSRFTAALLVCLITVAVLAQVFSSTLLSPKYLTKTASKANTYSELSKDLTTKIITSLASQPSNGQITLPEVEAIVGKVVTPALIQTKVTQALTGIQAYDNGTGPLPSINLSDVIIQLQAAGLPVTSSNSPISTNITLNGFVQVRQQVRHFREVKIYSTIAAVLLLMLLFFLSWEEHRWKILPDLSIIVGILLGIVSLVFIFSYSVANRYIKLNSNSSYIEGTAKDFAKTLTHSLGLTIGEIALVLLVVGIVTRIILQKTPQTKKPTKSKAKPKKKK